METVLGIPLELFIIILIWSLVWTGLALWRSARRSEKVWFIIILITNTLGLLEIIYLFLIAREPKKKAIRKSKRKK